MQTISRPDGIVVRVDPFSLRSHQNANAHQQFVTKADPSKNQVTPSIKATETTHNNNNQTRR